MRTCERSRDNVCPGLPAIKWLLRMRRVLNVRQHLHYPNLERQTDRFQSCPHVVDAILSSQWTKGRSLNMTSYVFVH